jgi:SAM-dependent methyltransferase
VQRLRDRFPVDTFVRVDIGSDLGGLDGRRFDAISAIDVLFHLLDDDTYRRAFANVFALLKPGGLLVCSENFLHGEPLRLPHQVSRTLPDIERVVADAELTILRRRPLFFAMNAPHDSSNRLHHLWWRGLAGLATRSNRAGAAAGALLYPFELALVARLREGPSTELMLGRRPS